MTLSSENETYRCKLCSDVYPKNDAVSHLNRTHNVSLNDASLVLSLLEPTSFSSKGKANGFDLRQKVNARSKGHGSKSKGDDDDYDWVPGGTKKRHSYTSHNGEFRCDACHRHFKREGQLDRHKCFKDEALAETTEHRESKKRKQDVRNRVTSNAKLARPQIDHSAPITPVVQPVSKIDCLEEGPFFLRVKKDLSVVETDVASQTKKIEVQVSVEGDVEEIIRDMHQCLECLAVLPTLDEAQKHLKGHLPTSHYVCKFCTNRERYTDDSLGGVLKHVRMNHASKYSSNLCARCGFEAASDFELDQHMEDKHFPGATYTCQNCGEQFGLSIFGLVNHVRTKHAEMDPELMEAVVIEAKTLYQSDDIFECNLCEKIFFVKSHIEAHKEVHANGSLGMTDDDCCGLFKCTHCKYQANHIEELRLHLGAAHQHLTCKLCNAIIFSGATYTENLLNHVVSCHDTRYDFEALIYYEELFKEAKNLFSVKASLKCKICPKMFFTRKSFTDHMRSHEGGNVSKFYCEVCDFSCATRQKLHRHVRSHKFLYYCPDCKLFFSSNQNLQEHLINMHSESEELPCEEYKRSLLVSLFLPEPGFPSAIPLNYVNNQSIMEYYKGRTTNLCGEKFDFPKYAQTSLIKLSQEDNESAIVDDEGYESPMELTDSAKLSDADSNQKTPVGELATESGGDAKPDPDTSQPEQGTTILLVTGEEGSEDQIAIELPPGTDGAQTLRELGLNVENLDLSQNASLASLGLKTKLELSMDSPYVSCENTEFCLALASHKFCWMTEEALQALMNCFGEMECLYCGKFYNTPSRFYAHQNIHTKATQFKCDQCEYYSHSIQLLRYHQDRNHGIENLRCNVCDFTTNSRVKLSRHLKKHSQTVERRCSKCQFTCENERRMREHFTIAHPESSLEDISNALGGKRNMNVGKNLNIEPCNLCGKVFGSSRMEEHMRSHKEENVLKCSQCDFTCKSEAYLQAHEHNHEKARAAEELKAKEEQPRFACLLCSSHLKTEKALTSHIVNVHFENDTCPQCGHEAANRGDFHCHLLIHSEEKSYACNLCPTVLLHEGKMEEHFRTKHPGLRMHYTSFINENPISIADIVQMPRQELGESPVSTAVGGTASEASVLSQPSTSVSVAQQSASAFKQTPTSSLISHMPANAMQGSSSMFVQPSASHVPQTSVADSLNVPNVLQPLESVNVPSEPMMITEDQINAALQALVEAGEHLPEGAEIMVEDNTLYVDGVAKVVIAPADDEVDKYPSEEQQTGGHINVNDPDSISFSTDIHQPQQPEAASGAERDTDPASLISSSASEESQSQLPAASVSMGSTLDVDDVMAATEATSPEVERRNDAVKSVDSQLNEAENETSHEDRNVVGSLYSDAADSSAIAQQLTMPGAAEPLSQSAEADEEEPYIDLANLDFSNIDLPPGNYNLVVDEQGQAVFVPTDVINENTIQIVAE